MVKIKPEDWTWIGDLPGRRAQLTPDRIAIIDNIEKQTYSYLDMNIRANQLARLLLDIGITKGDRVVMFSKNRLDCIDLLFATGKIGAILVPLNIRLSIQELKYLIEQTTPSLLVYDSELINKVSEIKNTCAINEYMVMGYQSFDEDIASRQSMGGYSGLDIRRPQVEFDDPNLILFTGGTTGFPKGAILSHRLIFWNSMNTILSWGLRPDDIQPLLFPLFHTGGWNVLLLPCYYQGSTTILMEVFDPVETLQVIEDEQCTIVVGVPTMFIMILNSEKFKKTNIDTVRVFISVGATCPEEVMREYWDRGKILKMGYELTEVGPNNFYIPEDLVKEYPLSVGFPVLNCEAKIVNPKTNKPVLGREAVGELLLKGPHIFSGYWNNPEATNNTIESNGWVHTGDLVKQDVNGLYYIVGRKKEMYISGGENIYPIEIEEALYQHPNIDMAAVIDVPDEKWGEVGKCFVTLKKGKSITVEEIKAHLQKKLARYKIPKYFEIKDELPLSSTGKILKRELK
ncbi:MAG: AMP-binding protein [Candidatus Hodarchaeota archaeon]